MWLKCCPRCRGDLFQARDDYGYYIACAQCGKHLTVAEEAVLRSTGDLPPPAPVRGPLAARGGSLSPGGLHAEPPPAPPSDLSPDRL